MVRGLSGRGLSGRVSRSLLVVAALLALGACGPMDQSMLAPAGPIAGRVARLWWFSLAVSTVVYLATMAMLFAAMLRARRRERSGATADTAGDRRLTAVVIGAVGATVAILMVFFGYDLSVGRTLTIIPSQRPITIELTGHQWWWEVTYADPSPQGRFTTANEIHVPVGEPVLFLLASGDVIHSLWVPNLAGKKDLIPGFTQSFWFQADTAGVYRGQCAEFCGHQHAKMALLVIAEPMAEFQEWARQQRQTATTPSDSMQARGQEIFLTGSCVMCHSIRGTPAGSHAGPDLTHLASRRTIAAGTLPNVRGALAGWIVDPQQVKPGTKMPPNRLTPDDLNALLAYMESLR